MPAVPFLIPIRKPSISVFSAWGETDTPPKGEKPLKEGFSVFGQHRGTRPSNQQLHQPHPATALLAPARVSRPTGQVFREVATARVNDGRHRALLSRHLWGRCGVQGKEGIRPFPESPMGKGCSRNKRITYIPMGKNRGYTRGALKEGYQCHKQSTATGSPST